MIFKAAQFEKYIKKPQPEIKVFVVYGSNEGLVAEYTKKLINTVSKDLYDPFAVVYLAGTDVNDDPGVLFAEYTSQSLMGGRRVIVVRDADNNLTKNIKYLLENLQSDTLLVITSSSLNRKSSLVALGETNQEMVALACYDDRDEDVFATARAKFIENGLTINNEALQLMCSRLSNDRKSSMGEIEKLITYMGDKKNVTTEDVRAIISDQSASNSEDVCYYAAGGYIDKALASLQKLFNEGDEPVAIVRALSYHFNRLLTCKAFMEKGEPADKVIKKLVPKVIFYRESSFKRQLALWPKDKIFSVLELLYKCEKDCKTTNMPTNEILSYTIMQISSAAARLGKAV